jgi:hypothetical protein
MVPEKVKRKIRGDEILLGIGGIGSIYISVVFVTQTETR